MKPETREGIRYSLTVFLAVRAGLFVLGLVAVTVIPPLKPVSIPGWPAGHLPDFGWHNIFTSFERWDGLWFLRIAAEGYREGDGSAAFFPLYPLVIRAVSWAIGGHPLAASLIVSNVSIAAALCVLYLLTVSEFSVQLARRSVLFLALFPTSFFFFAPYSESLFLLLSMTSFWGARSRRWAVAGVAGALAALTRNVGLIVAPALIIEAFHQRFERRGSPIPGILAGATTALGTGAYLAFWDTKAGTLLAPMTQQANWGRVIAWPWVTLSNGGRAAFVHLGATNGGYWFIDWIIVVPILGASVYALLRYRPSYGIYLWAGLLIPLSFIFPPRPLMSMPRFVLSLFPAFWALAEVSERLHIPPAAVVALESAGLGLLTVLFVNWYYIF